MQRRRKGYVCAFPPDFTPWDPSGRGSPAGLNIEVPSAPGPDAWGRRMREPERKIRPVDVSNCQAPGRLPADDSDIGGGIVLKPGADLRLRGAPPRERLPLRLAVDSPQRTEVRLLATWAKRQERPPARAMRERMFERPGARRCATVAHVGPVRPIC
jgi:hypothetical protein